MSTLAQTVFETISEHFGRRAKDIVRFAEAGYSFEEWCNWEAFTACAKRPAWHCVPKPSYASLGVEESRDYGDLLVTDETTGGKVIVEIGIVHDGTHDRWRDKLARDRAKIQRVHPNHAVPLQIVLVAKANGRIESSPGTWLSKVEFWNQAPFLESATPLAPSGQMLLRGWVIDLPLRDT